MRMSINVILPPSVIRVKKTESGIDETCRAHWGDHKVKGKHKYVAVLN
jgi:hypothetical protein